MVKVSDATKKKVKQAVHEYFLSSVIDRINAQVQLLNQLAETFKSTGIDTTKKRKTANEIVIKLIDYNYNFKLNSAFRDEFPSYHFAIDAALSQINEQITVEQSDDHFNTLPSDAGVIRFSKATKKLLLKATWAGTSFANVFRKIKKEKTFFNRKIPLRACHAYFIKTRFGIHLLELLSAYENDLLYIIDQADSICRSVTQKAANPINGANQNGEIESLTHLAEQCKALINPLVNEADQKLEQEIRLLQTALTKVGTLELNASFFDEKLNQRREQQIEKQYQKWTIRIARNHKVLKENWLLSHQINVFYESLKLASKKVCDRLNVKVQRHQFKQIDRLADFLKASYSPFEISFADKDNLKSAILNERSRINGNFKKELVPNAMQMMLFQNLPTVTLALDHDFDKSLSSISTQVHIKKHFKVDEKLRESDLSSINPRDIISFEYFSALRQAKDKLHDELVKINNRIQPSLIEISNIHAYTFETAIKNLEQSTASLKEIDQTIKQGAERTFEKIEHLKETLLSVTEKATTELDKALNELNKDLQYLNNNDSAFELNVRLLERKTRLRTKSYRTRLLQSFEKSFSSIRLIVRKNYKKLLNIYKSTEKSLSQTDDAPIDINLANFLSTAQLSFDKLPFIYRLLFRLEPLEDFNFYVERHIELSQLNKAYESWENGHFGSTIITGPKWSGLSSLFNKFENELPTDIQVNRILPKQNVSTSEQLIQLLKDTFNQSKFENTEDVANYLVNSGIKRVVFVDELQRFFLRKINGFEILNELQKIIRISHNQVFWIVGLAEISANYLRKTTSIHEFFAWNINLRPLNQKEVKQLIMKRHLVGGYKLMFSEKIAPKGSKLSKLNTVEKQEQLKNLFFEKLTKISEGSLGLSLFLWVLSIDMKDKQSVFINPLIPVNDILRGLESNKMSILHALVLHDGLAIKELNQVLNFHISKTRNLLSSLEKDGVIENKNDFFKINPLLHWSALNMLHKRNLIH